MSTTKDKLERIVNDSNIQDKSKEIELYAICQECPDFQKCSSCDDEPWKWWEVMVEQRAKERSYEDENMVADSLTEVGTIDDE